MNSLMKKGAGVLALLAAVLLVLAGWSFRPVQAELTETKTVTAAFTPASAANGQEVTLTVDIQGWFGGAQLVLDYNADQLTYVDGSATSSVGVTINDAQRGRFNVLYVNTSGIDLGDQDFFTARFVVNAPAGESLDVSFSRTDVCSTDASEGFYPVDVQTQPLAVVDQAETTSSAPETSTSDTSASSSGETSSQGSSSGSAASGAIVLPQGQHQLLASGLPGTVTWSSSDESVATVDENGMVTMVGEGDAVITATDGSGEETFRVSTEASVSSGLTSAPGADDPEDATFLWWVLGGIGAVLVIAAVVVVVIVLKKKR